MQSPLRAAARIAALVGAAGSLVLTFLAGRGNSSIILMLLFALWVPFPFLALLWAHAVSKRWPALTQMTLYTATLLLALASLAIYTHAVLWPPKAQAAFVFIAVPPASCLLLAIVIGIAALISRKA